MINVAFDELYANYPSSTTYRPNYVSQQDLFREIGWDALLNNPLYANTCAVRVSLAFVRSGIKISPKSHNILKGPHANKGLEVSMRRLADLLATTRYLGNYESYTSKTAQSGIGARKGVVAFNGIRVIREAGISIWSSGPLTRLSAPLPATTNPSRSGSGRSCRAARPKV